MEGARHKMRSVTMAAFNIMRHRCISAVILEQHQLHIRSDTAALPVHCFVPVCILGCLSVKP